MSNSPDHLSRRTLLPGALLAVLVTAGALFALAVVIAVGPDGPVRLWLDGGGSTLSMQPRAGGSDALRLPGGPVALLTDAPTVGPKGAVTLAIPPRAARLRGDTRVQRRAARLPSASRPGGSAPPSGATPTTPTTLVSAPAGTTPRPSATPGPGSTVVKTRGRGKGEDTTPAPVAVGKQRTSSGAQPVPASTPGAPVEILPYRPSSEPVAVVGLEDGVLTRVPPPARTNGDG